MDAYSEVFAFLREQYEILVPELGEADADAVFKIIDGFASLTDATVAHMLEADLNQALKDIQDEPNQFGSLSNMAIDLQIRDTACQGSTVPMEDDIIDNNRASSEAIAPAPHTPVAMIPTTASPSASTDPVLFVMPETSSAPLGRNKRKREKRSTVKRVNLDWLKHELSPTSFSLLCHYIGNEDELVIEVQKRFKVIFSLDNQGDEDGIFDFEGIPQDLRTVMRVYLGSSIRRQAENYYGYVMARKVHKRVEDENKEASEVEKKKRYKEIFSAIAGAYLNEGEGKNDTLHCRKCKIFADKCGVFVLVLYDIFSKNFITRLINDEGINKDNIENIVNVFTSMLSKRFMNATIENGEFKLPPEDTSVVEVN